MKYKVLFIAWAMSISAPSFADKISDSGFIGCKDKKDMISLAFFAKAGASVNDFTAEVKKLEASKKCRMFKKGDKVEIYTFGDKETGADIHQIAFPAGSNSFYWIDKKAISLD